MLLLYRIASCCVSEGILAESDPSAESNTDGRGGGKPYRIADTSTFGLPKWFDIVSEEYAACREAIGLCDYSSFTKIDLWVRRTFFGHFRDGILLL